MQSSADISNNRFAKIMLASKLRNLATNSSRRNRITSMPPVMREQWQKIYGDIPESIEACSHMQLKISKISEIHDFVIIGNKILCSKCASANANNRLLPVNINALKRAQGSIIDE